MAHLDSNAPLLYHAVSHHINPMFVHPPLQNRDKIIDIVTVLSSLKAFEVLQFEGVVNTAIEELHDPCGTKSEFHNIVLPNVKESLVKMGWSKDVLDERIDRVVQSYYIPLVARPVMRKLSCKKASDYGDTVLTATTLRKGLTVRQLGFIEAKDGVLRKNRNKTKPRCSISTPNELWDMIAFEFVTGYHGRIIKSRYNKRPGWTLRLYPPGTARTSEDTIMMPGAFEHEITELLAGACNIEQTRAGNQDDVRMIRDLFFRQDIVFPDWSSVLHFLCGQPTRAAYLRRFSVAMQRYPIGFKRFRFSSVGKTLDVMPDMNNALEELAKSIDVNQLILSISLDGDEYLAVFLRQIPPDPDIDDHYNWLWMDEVPFLEYAPRPSPVGGFKRSEEDVYVADENEYISVMSAYRQHDKDHGILRGPILEDDIAVENFVIHWDADFQSPSNVRFQEASRIMQTPAEHDVSLACFNMSITPGREAPDRYLYRCGGSRAGAEQKLYSTLANRAGAWRRHNGSSASGWEMLTRKRAAWRIDAMGLDYVWTVDAAFDEIAARAAKADRGVTDDGAMDAT